MASYRLEFIRCGKPNCWCAGARSGQGHGPYWYMYWREGKKVRKKYIGRVRIDFDQHDFFDDRSGARNGRFEVPEYEGRMTQAKALRLMALDTIPTHLELQARWRQLMRIHHPDIGGDVAVCAAINAAYDFLKYREATYETTGSR